MSNCKSGATVSHDIITSSQAASSSSSKKQRLEAAGFLYYSVFSSTNYKF